MRVHLIWAFALVAFPLVGQAQAPEGIPIVKIVHDQSSIKFGVKGVGAHRGCLRQVGRDIDVHVSARRDGSFGREDSGGERRHWERNEGWQAEG